MVYINFEDIEEQYLNMQKCLGDIESVFDKIRSDFFNIHPGWCGNASEHYIEKINKLMEVFIPAVNELKMSIIFIKAVSAGYDSLQDEKSQKMLDAINGYFVNLNVIGDKKSILDNSVIVDNTVVDNKSDDKTIPNSGQSNNYSKVEMKEYTADELAEIVKNAKEGKYGEGKEMVENLGDLSTYVLKEISKGNSTVGLANTSKVEMKEYTADELAEIVKNAKEGKYGEGKEMVENLGDLSTYVLKEISKGNSTAGVSSGNLNPNALKPENLDAIALQVIRGDWGNGDVRKAKLGDYYDVIQKRVNELMREMK